MNVLHNLAFESRIILCFGVRSKTLHICQGDQKNIILETMVRSVNDSDPQEWIKIGRLSSEYLISYPAEVITMCTNFIPENEMSGDYFWKTLEEMGEKLIMDIMYDAKQEKPITADKFSEFRECNDGEHTFRKYRTENDELDGRYWYIPKSIIPFDPNCLCNKKLFCPRCLDCSHSFLKCRKLLPSDIRKIRPKCHPQDLCEVQRDYDDCVT